MNLYIYLINHLNQIMRKLTFRKEIRFDLKLISFLDCLKKIYIIFFRIIILKWVRKMEIIFNYLFFVMIFL
jgi:hypothetical protein